MFHFLFWVPNKAKLTPAGLLLVSLIGCASYHSSNGFLLAESAEDGIFSLAKDENGQYVSNNPIFVEHGSIFTINVENLNAGWIHFDDKSAPESLDTEKWSKKEAEHIRGKELWLLFTIIALDSSDPLELKRKQYFHATNVKFGSESFRSIPLDSAEKQIFAHEADEAYRVAYKVYEVDNFDLKRAAVEVFQNSPGIAGIGQSLLDSVTSVLGSVLGDGLVNMVKSKEDEKLLLERLLLSQGAEIELSGSFLILRKTDHVDSPADTEEMEAKKEAPPATLLTKEYLLYDYFKSNSDAPRSFKNKTEYTNIQKLLVAHSVNTKNSNGGSYIHISVTQARKLDKKSDIERLTKLADKDECDKPNDQLSIEECIKRAIEAEKVEAFLLQTLD